MAEVADEIETKFFIALRWFNICQQLSFARVSSKVNTIFVRARELREVKNVKKTENEAFLLHEHDGN